MVGDARQSLGRRLTEPLESAAQTVARRATELVVESLDMNALLEQIDLNRLLDHIDVNRLLERIDVDTLMAKVDVNALVDKVDVNEIADRIDVAGLVDKTEIGTIVAKSSSSILKEGIDSARSQAVGLDDFLARWANRILRRKQSPPVGPSRLAGLQVEP